ncbi:phage tail protein [Ideonella sp. 4Y16]|uniref:Phage tail protein n=1 Tax=Ideonella alba TaxID=2824118 RepID=A0A940YBF6_9BURK|nr:tail fiber protein [Ideonella alba]MBQ0932091.1 phage tail protein [Ideonella alba]MBQ0945627.1 phage tail protein [Ideonella alba]
MSTPYLGEIRVVSFNFVPRGWALCNGQVLPIAQNQGLFALLGTTYGGDGRTTFALPDLRGRQPMHAPAGSSELGARLGEASHALTAEEMPTHRHPMRASKPWAETRSPSNAMPATHNDYGGAAIFAPIGKVVPLHPETVAASGQGQPHSNMNPYLTLNFMIALQGIFPSAT